MNSYEKVTPPTPNASSYSFVGYATTYRWYFLHTLPEKQTKVSDGPFPYPEKVSLSQMPSRLRIAQFLVLEPHQLAGHGSYLYLTIQSACLADPTIFELTIEDPNEAFDALRDTNDYNVLHPEFSNRDVTINPDPYPADTGRRHSRLVPTSSLIPTATLRNLRSTFKIAPTQFAHLCEMYLLSRIPETHRGKNANMARLLVQKWKAPNEHDKRYYWWRMLVKQRLYKRNRDILIQLDQHERMEKLDETVQNVEEGYERLLKAFDAKMKRRQEVEEEASETGDGTADSTQRSRERSKRKRAVVEDDEDEEGDDAAGTSISNGADGGNSVGKKSKK